MSGSVVAAIDGSAGSAAAAEWAAGEAAALGAELLLVYVVADEPEPGTHSADADAGPLLERAAGEVAGRYPALRVTTRLRHGDPGSELAAAGAEAEAGLLVLRAPGAEGWEHAPAGGAAFALTARASCPVVLVPRGERQNDGDEVVLGVDARHADQSAVDLAFATARRRGAVLRAVHAWGLPPAAERLPYTVTEEDRGAWEDQELQRLSDTLRGWREKYPAVHVHDDLRLLPPDEALPAASARAERIVIGRGGPAMSPTARAVLRRARCPVVVVPTT
ncbi:universal stress protein [Streptomyces sp. WMMC500]|uniref:universal stress protein n=1 Tax=Streptomyces sp. WMMC500 TaxID=3015154 RepID=UPI00248C1A84|nr:universal stress protein [Streptomyces sp. WMMC500]WBB61960.1 universal stress protein [Streptomyces sp. WMMC500]